MDFTNLAIFCRLGFSLSFSSPASSNSTDSSHSEESKEEDAKSPKTSSKRITFRPAVEADFLNSYSRKAFLVPDPKLELDASLFQDRLDDNRSSRKDGEEAKDQVLRQAAVPDFEKNQVESAVGHWKLMREVLPPVVWELW
jgi:hypothetical protein